MRRNSDSVIFIVSIVIALLGGAVMVAAFAYHNHQIRTSVLMPTDTLNGWKYYQDTLHESKGGVVVDHGALQCFCLTSNGKPDSLLLTQHHFIVESGHKYHVAFTAKASAPFTIHFFADTGGYNGTSDNFGLDKTYQIDEQWTKHEETFTATGQLGYAVDMPKFGIGSTVGTVWIKDVSIDEVK